MISVERASHYLEIESELSAKDPIHPVALIDGMDDSSSNRVVWPTKGEVTFRNVVLKYRPTLEPSLKRITFSIKSHEKVRTTQVGHRQN